jgi:hypothetical protein
VIERVIEALIEDGMQEATNVLVTGTRYFTYQLELKNSRTFNLNFYEKLIVFFVCFLVWSG